jgi:hypothetical protein
MYMHLGLGFVRQDIRRKLTIEIVDVLMKTWTKAEKEMETKSIKRNPRNQTRKWHAMEYPDTTSVSL